MHARLITRGLSLVEEVGALVPGYGFSLLTRRVGLERVSNGEFETKHIRSAEQHADFSSNRCTLRHSALERHLVMNMS